MKTYFKYLISFCFFSFLTFCNAQEKLEKGFTVSVNSKIVEATMSKEEFKNALFAVHSYNPEYNNVVKLKGFSLKYPGFKLIQINGNKLNVEAIQKLEKLKKGDQITVFDAISNSFEKYVIEINPMIITIK